jgi:hypothetical protein
VVSCCEYGDEPLGSCAMELVRYISEESEPVIFLDLVFWDMTQCNLLVISK